jgi:DNA-binding transcriptional LysR family regulator
MPDIDLRQIDLNLLVALERLLARGTVTGAAKDLGITQPAMSRTLQRLRDVLGDPLFVKVGRTLEPTDHARGLQSPLTEALGSVRRVLEPPAEFEPKTATGELTLALGDEAQIAFADAIVHAVWAEAPGIDIRVRPLSLASLDEGRRGILDLAVAPDIGVLPGTSVDYADMVVKRLYTRSFVVARAEGAPGALDLDAFCEAAHVIIASDGAGHAFVDDLLATLGRRRRVAATVTSFPIAARLVAATDLVATMPEEVVATSGAGIRAYAPPLDMPTVPMLLLWHPRRTADLRHRFLRRLVERAITQRERSWRLPSGR